MTDKIRISLRIENRERYLTHLDKTRHTTPKMFIKAMCQKFSLEEKPDYVILLEPDSIIYDMSVVNKNDHLRLLERAKLQAIQSELEMIKQKALESRKQLIQAGQWRPQPVPNPYGGYSNMNYNQYGYQYKGGVPSPFNRGIGFPLYNPMNDSRLIIPVKRAMRLPEKIDYEDMQNNVLQIMTPDFEEFSSGILHAGNRKELCQTIKVLALQKGFRINVPYGKQESRITYFCHKTGARKSNSSKKTNCPFQLI
jgi:hypothetical protein